MCEVSLRSAGQAARGEGSRGRGRASALKGRRLVRPREWAWAGEGTSVQAKKGEGILRDGGEGDEKAARWRERTTTSDR